MKLIIPVLIIIVIGSLAGAGYFLFPEKMGVISPKTTAQPEENPHKLVDFSAINSEFLFSAQIPKDFEAEYLPNVKAINIYNPLLEGSNNLEKSQIYLTFFKANSFLTLRTVDITKQEPVTVAGRDAIVYEITKKADVPNFYGQPNWRNTKHVALDIRLTKTNPSYFYSFAQNPAFPDTTFNNIIDSLAFEVYN